MSEVDLNKSPRACSPCIQECKKINERINKRKMSQVKIIGDVVRFGNFI